MNTPVAITDMICRTVLYLAAIGAGAHLIRPVLPRLQMAAQKTPRPPETAVTVAGQAVGDDTLAAAVRSSS